MAEHAVRSCGARDLVASMALALVAMLAPIPSQAILIDNFNAGAFVITDGGFGSIAGSGIVGGERDMGTGSNIFGEFSSNKGGNGRLELNFTGGVAAGASFDVTYDGIDNAPTQDFAGLNKADFTDGGTSDSIRVRLVETTVALNIQITVQQLVSGENWFLQHDIDVGPIAAPTDLFFPFDEFVKSCSFCGTADFAMIDWMRIRFFPVDSNGTPFHASVDFIQTQIEDPDGPRDVATPPILALLAAGLASLGIVRRSTKASRAGAPIVSNGQARI